MAKAADKTEKKAKKGRTKRPNETVKAPVERFPKIPRVRTQTPKGKHGGMELMLIEDVEHVGKQGEIVEVKPGYGRNYLLPQGLATYVTTTARVRIEKHKAKVEALRIARVAELKVVAKKLEAIAVTIQANANEEGHLYGSVTGVDVAAALSKDAVARDAGIVADQVKLEGPLKELGLYHVKVQLTPDVEAEIKVWVVPAGDKAAQ
ncbi:MAG TPA: 50S ribosomal protein L9 [Planctomycetia bacterium]|nr:50S ribosomal protein L9 [Planctomycetia bacterium]